MSFHSLSVENVRSYDLYNAPLDAGITLIIGPNGSGKTTLLEALYYACRGTSFRGRDRDIIAYNKKRALIKLTDIKGEERRARLWVDSEKMQKEFIVQQKKTARLTQPQKIPVVLFEPDELRLLTSSPKRRRDFFDGIIARLSPTYQTVYNRYARTLLQRNELLKKQKDFSPDAWNNHLFAWDVKFAELAQKIAVHRHEFIALSNKKISTLYSSLAKHTHTIHAEYKSTISSKNYNQSLLHALYRNRHSDAVRGYTSVGPHRDDIGVYLDAHLASETASRGEMRTIMLAYKLLEVILQTNIHDTTPLILMDDVFSELDITREKQLMQALKKYQTIITATDLRDEMKVSASVINLS
jgi:DNA replication and repair protein RecF